MKKISIAIDGTSSSGKSSFARKIAARLGYRYIDTGAMYRAVTLYARRNGFIHTDSTLDADGLSAQLGSLRMDFLPNRETGRNELYLNGENVEQSIRSMEINEYVSAVSQLPCVREQLVRMQRQIGSAKGVVMDGRDIGTVVLPQAELKIFMTADPEVRAMRRYKELLEKGEKVVLEEILENIRKRDRADTTRKVSPLKKAPDALTLDNSQMNIQEQMAWVEQKIRQLTEE
ncbi:MAG: (d)CMP kinase [Rikenellaceae bacterium]|nr:(d)CMP kinase [Rikenellaceae bacterium]